MSSIFACKMFKACKHPERIIAAVQNPINQQLVTQIKQYLGPDALTLLQEAEAKKLAEAEAKAQAAALQEGVPAGPSQSSPSAGGFSGGGAPPMFDEPLAEKYEDDFEGEENSAANTAAFSEAADDALGEPDEAQASTDSEKQMITGEETVEGAEFSDELKKENLESIPKRELNNDARTAGVDRVQLKGDELWIYYNDDTNLNKVMSDAVDLLAAKGFTELTFNRLARSNNAIVFTVEGAPYETQASAT